MSFLSLHSSHLSPFPSSSLQPLKQVLRRPLSIPLGIPLCPPPQIHTCILDTLLRLPTQLPIRSRRIRGQVQDVSCAAAHDLVLELLAAGGTKGPDDGEDGAAFAGAQVPGSHARVVGAEVGEGREVALREVFDVEVVADCGTVRGGVVYQ